MPLERFWDGQVLPVANGLWRFHLDPGYRIEPARHRWRLHRRKSFSITYHIDTQPPSIAKLTVPRSTPRDSLRKYIHSSARREYRAAQILQSLGLRTPTVLGWGVSFAPTAGFESIVFMRTLPAFITGLSFIRQETDTARRDRFFERVARDISRVYGHGLDHKDCHFDNLCLMEDDSLVWIDNDVRKLRDNRQYARGFAETLRALARSAGDHIGPGEWQRFIARLRDGLSDYSRAAVLTQRLGHPALLRNRTLAATPNAAMDRIIQR